MVKINRIALIIANIRADLALILPLGISLILAVRIFFLSISLSKYLLNAIAADLAKIIDKIT